MPRMKAPACLVIPGLNPMLYRHKITPEVTRKLPKKVAENTKTPPLTRVCSSLYILPT